jgi:hypothetical protein
VADVCCSTGGWTNYGKHRDSAFPSWKLSDFKADESIEPPDFEDFELIAIVLERKSET